MLRNVFLKTLRDARRALVWWSFGLIGMTALMIAVYPTVRDNPDLNKLVQDYPEALKAFIAFGGEIDYVSGAGYLGSGLFSFMVPHDWRWAAMESSSQTTFRGCQSMPAANDRNPVRPTSKVPAKLTEQ